MISNCIHQLSYKSSKLLSFVRSPSLLVKPCLTPILSVGFPTKHQCDWPNLYGRCLNVIVNHH